MQTDIQHQPLRQLPLIEVLTTPMPSKKKQTCFLSRAGMPGPGRGYIAPTHTVGVCAAVCGCVAGRVTLGVAGWVARARDPPRHTITTTAHTTYIYCRGVCCCLWLCGGSGCASRARRATQNKTTTHTHTTYIVRKGVCVCVLLFALHGGSGRVQ